MRCAAFGPLFYCSKLNGAAGWLRSPGAVKLCALLPMMQLEACMADRAELVEAALEAYPEGMALMDESERVVFWNRAAEMLTGHSGAQLVGRALPGALEALLRAQGCDGQAAAEEGMLVHLQHVRGHDAPVMARRLALRDGLGGRIGTGVAFYAAARAAALPHGETSEGSEVRASQEEMRDRLEAAHRKFLNDGGYLGVLWIGVDQARELRSTHGAQACETMLESVERTLANARRPEEEMGRWGDGEFLMICHERCAEVLANHGQVLAGIARTADFRWWGDRLSLSVSVGAAQAEPGEPLYQLLDRAKTAMTESMQRGGNRVTAAKERLECLPSLES